MRRALAAAATAVLLAGCHSGSTGTATSAATNRAASTRTTTASGTSGLPTCALSTLPREARTTVRLVAAGGPFPYPRNDGVAYQNRNKVLPQRARGTYREFTVRTPGASNRGARRVVTDGNARSGVPTTTPSAWYYTGDHYDSFCEVTGAP